MKTKWIPGFLIFYSIVAILDAFLGFEVPKYEIFGASLGIYVLFAFATQYKKIARRLLLIVLIIIIGIFVTDYALNWGVQRFSNDGMSFEPGSPWIVHEGIKHNVSWLSTLREALDIRPFITWILEGRSQNINFDRTFFIMLTFGLSFLIYKIYETKWLKLCFVIPIVLFIFGWYNYTDFSWTVYAGYFVGIGAYIIIEKHHQLIAQKPEYKTSYYSRRLIVLWSFGMSIILFASSSLMYWALPVDLVNDQIIGVIPNLWGVRTGHVQNELGVFSLLETPFQQDTGALGGPIRTLDDETALFWVTMDQPVTEPLYLKSTTKDFYTGKRWVSQTAVYRNEFAYYNELPQHRELIRTKGDGYMSGKIEMAALNSITLFTPMGFFNTDIDPEKVYVSIENEAFFKSGAWVRPIRSYTFEATGKDFNINPDLDYLQVGKSIDPRVHAMARALGRHGRGIYQKMTILTQYLIQNYDYDLLVPTDFVKEDFVSNFLLHMDSGYCTYFASALTIMARINHIPARYVEGFVIAPSAFDKEGNRAKVTEAQAHAWTEVYFPDRGWVIFEPTPPYNTDDLTGPLFYTVPEVEIVEPTNETDSEPLDIDDDLFLGAIDVFEDGMEGPIDFDRPIRDPRVREEEGDVFEDQEENFDEENKKNKSRTILLILVLLILLPLSILPGYFYLNPRDERSQIIRWIYFLGHVIGECRGLKHPNLEVRFLQIGVPKDHLTYWFKALYDQKHLMNGQELRFVISDVKKHTKMETDRFIIKYGRLAYFKMRFFDIKKITS